MIGARGLLGLAWASRHPPIIKRRFHFRLLVVIGFTHVASGSASRSSAPGRFVRPAGVVGLRRREVLRFRTDDCWLLQPLLDAMAGAGRVAQEP